MTLVYRLLPQAQPETLIDGFQWWPESQLWFIQQLPKGFWRHFKALLEAKTVSHWGYFTLLRGMLRSAEH